MNNELQNNKLTVREYLKISCPYSDIIEYYQKLSNSKSQIQNMFPSKILHWLFYLKISSCNCTSEVKNSKFSPGGHFYQVSKAIKLPLVVNEGSGLVRSAKDSTFWTLNDGGGKAEIYEINKRGKLLKELLIPNTKNQDWEEITRDEKGHLFIGDFGNNENTRKDLVIYKFPENQPNQLEKIQFHYADQKAFPPNKKDLNFDCEAFFALGDSLYLFSKNRGDKSVKLYIMPSLAGVYTLVPQEKIFLKTMVTGAALSPNKKIFALLTYGKVFLFYIGNQGVSLKKPLLCIKFAHKQTEGITFLTDETMLISNEQGEMFEVRISK